MEALVGLVVERSKQESLLLTKWTGPTAVF